MIPQSETNNECVKLYGRTHELETMEKVLHRAATSGKSGIIMVEGPSGVGKRSLVWSALKKDRSCLVASSVFTSDESSPFDSIICAIVELISRIKVDEDLTEKLRNRIRVEFSQEEVRLFTRFVPIFSIFMDKSALQSPENGVLTCTANEFSGQNMLAQFKLLVQIFLRLITGEHLVVLCLFNIHKADTPSLDLIEFFAKDDEISSLVVIATNEDIGDPTLDQPFLRLKHGSQGVGTNDLLTVIQLSGLDLDSLNAYIADKFVLDKNVTVEITRVVWSLTNGNPFFVLQLLEHWQKEGLLCLVVDNNCSRWSWDMDKIRESPPVPNVVDLVSNRLCGHPQNVQQVLQLAACLGFKFDVCALCLLHESFSDELPADGKEVIEFCVEEGFLEPMSDGFIKFSNNEIFQAARCSLPLGDSLEILHLKIGLTLMEYLLSHQEPLDDIIVLCFNQISIGYDHLQDRAIKLKFAEICRDAGMIAMKMAAYVSSSSYNSRGINVLNDLGDKWEVNHDLCMSLFVNYSQSEYFLGRFESSLQAINELLYNQPSVASRLQANVTRLCIIKAQSNLTEFISASLSFLCELGIRFPKRPAKAVAQLELHRVKRRVDQFSDEQLLTMREMADPSMAAAVKVMNAMMVPLEALTLTNLGILVACRAVRLCLLHGTCEDCAEAFVIFGIFCIANGGWLAEGYRLGELSLSMSQKLDSSKSNPTVTSFAYLMTKPWQLTPMSQCVKPMFDCHVQAMKQCDPYMAFFIINHYFALSFYSSLDLRPLLKDIEKFSNQMLQYGQKMIFLHTLPIWQCVLNLVGASSNPLDLENGEARDRQHEVGNANGVGQQACWSFAMQVAVYMRDYDLASDMAARLEGIHLGITKAHVFYPARILFFGLVAIQKARTAGKGYRRQVLRYITLLRSWIKKKAANPYHKLLILEAEYASLFNIDGRALQIKYDAAIAASRKSGYIQDAALAAQLAADALQNVSPCFQQFSKSYLFQAHSLWIQWGAIAVASKLAQDHPELKSHKRHTGSTYLSQERYNPAIAEDHWRTL